MWFPSFYLLHLVYSNNYKLSVEPLQWKCSSPAGRLAVEAKDIVPSTTWVDSFK